MGQEEEPNPCRSMRATPEEPQGRRAEPCATPSSGAASGAALDSFPGQLTLTSVSSGISGPAAGIIKVKAVGGCTS